MDISSLNEVTILYAVVLHSLIAVMVLDRKILTSIRRKVGQKVLCWPLPPWVIKFFLSISPPLLLRLLNVDPILLRRHQAGQPVALSRPACYYLLAALRTICPQLLWRFGCWVAKLPRIRKYVLFCGKSRVVKFLRRNDFVQHWTVQQAVLLLTFLAANVVCVFIKSTGLSDAGLRSGRLAVINLVVLYAGPHLSFLADALDVPLSTYRHIHSSASLLVLSLALFHVIVAALEPVYSPSYVLKHKFALIVRRTLHPLNLSKVKLTHHGPSCLWSFNRPSFRSCDESCGMSFHFVYIRQTRFFLPMPLPAISRQNIWCTFSFRQDYFLRPVLFN